MKIQADKLKDTTVTHKEGKLKGVTYPLAIWKFDSDMDFSYNTGRGSAVKAVRNFGGIVSGHLIRCKTAKNERDYFLVVDSYSQSYSSKDIEFEFLCYCDELEDRMVDAVLDEKDIDSGICFDKIYDITKDITKASDITIERTIKLLNQQIYN